jgi:choline dehydrogenase
VTLRSADPKDHPRIVTGFLVDGGDMEIMIKGVRKMRDILACDPLKSLVREEVLPGPSATGDDQIVSHIKRFVKTVYHPMGHGAHGHGR